MIGSLTKKIIKKYDFIAITLWYITFNVGVIDHVDRSFNERVLVDEFGPLK